MPVTFTMHTTRISRLFLLCTFFAAGTGAGQATASELKNEIETWFQDLHQSFEKTCASPVVKKRSLTYTDRHFVRSLIANQTFYTLIRTNSKGIIVNEVIRGEKPRRDYRRISNQRWYAMVSRTRRPYHGFVKEDNGRYYLFWASPILITTRSGRTRFGGAVAVKIDLWDSFHKFTENTTTPFLIRMRGISLYSHKWKNRSDYHDEPLTIPGIKRITVRHAQPLEAPPQLHEAPHDSDDLDTLADAIQDPGLPIQTEKPQGPFSMRTILIIVGIILLITTIAAFRVVAWTKHKLLMRRIEKEDLL